MRTNLRFPMDGSDLEFTRLQQRERARRQALRGQLQAAPLAPVVTLMPLRVRVVRFLVTLLPGLCFAGFLVALVACCMALGWL